MRSDYQINIGLEIHVELKTATKIFCSCKNHFGDAPNTNVCPICLGFPGTLPSVNKNAIMLAIRAGLTLGSRISPHLLFDRKHYFYPDLPKSYQISQDALPLCIGGGIKLDSGKFVRFNHIHLEEDAGKLIHGTNTNKSYIDYNRAGIPLLEIVTEVDMSSAEETVEFLTKLRQSLVFADIAECKMEQAGLRADVNISVNKTNGKTLGTKVEIKNIGSFRSVYNTINFESSRQIDILESGAKVKQETRKWDEQKQITSAMREKEESKDYRYMAEPDFISINISPVDIDSIKNSLPATPAERFTKYVKEFQIPEQDAKLLVEEKHIADYFESCVLIYNQPKTIANWILTELFKSIKDNSFSTMSDIISEDNFCMVLKLLNDKKISRTNAKELLNKSIVLRANPLEVLKNEKLTGVVSTERITTITKRILAEKPELKEQFKDQPDKITNFITGLVIKATNGKADASLVKEQIAKIIH